MQRMTARYFFMAAQGLMWISFVAFAQDGGPHHKLAIGGYSPVSYFENNAAELGRPEFHASYKGKTYYFTSAEQVDKFNADPEKYRPLFNENCAYSLLLGRRLAIDPTNFKIVGGRLLLFHNSEEMISLDEWNKSPNEEENLHKARRQFELLKF